jgi:hypothetical protein
MTDTSYNPTFAPYTRWSVLQAPVPQTTHNLATSIAASASASTSMIVTEGFTMISAGITASQNGTLSIQRYLDAGGTVVQGAAQTINLTANTAANLDILDGKPFAAFTLTVTNASGSSASNLSNFALLLQAGTAHGANATTDGSTTITTGGTAQNLFGGASPANGYAICNPDTVNDLWVSDSTTAVANGAGCFRVAANGGYYATEPNQKPLGAVSIVGSTTGQKITARRW